MENLDNRISVNRDVIPPGSLPTGDPEWAFVSTPRHGKFIRAKNARIPCGAVRSSRVSIAGSEIDRSVDLSEWKICFPSRLSEIGGLSQLARSRTIRLYFQQDDSISSNLGKLGERWERRGKVEGPCLSPLGRKLMEYSEENGEQWWQSWFDACNSSRESKLWTFPPPSSSSFFYVPFERKEEADINLDQTRYLRHYLIL